MIRIRLRRVGKRGNPSYRIVVAESTAPRDGKYLEWIGNYDPMANPPAVSLKRDRVERWLQEGAQPSDAVSRILSREGILERVPTNRAGPQSSSSGAAGPEATGEAAPVEAAGETAVA